MRISDEERREVVRKLREPSELLNIRVPLFEALDMRPDVAETLVSSKNIEHNNRRLLNRLADLIDRPTCRLDRTGTELATDGYPIRVYECSNCGCTCDGIYDEHEYCPHCGAEVIDK